MGDAGALPGWVRDVLRCPACRGTLDDGADELVCGACALAYPVREGIPVLLADEARPTGSSSTQG